MLKIYRTPSRVPAFKLSTASTVEAAAPWKPNVPAQLNRNMDC